MASNPCPYPSIVPNQMNNCAQMCHFSKPIFQASNYILDTFFEVYSSRTKTDKLQMDSQVSLKRLTPV